MSSIIFKIFLALSISMFYKPIKAQDNQLTKKEKKAGWQLLFDGKTTNGWKGAFTASFPASGWLIQNGELMVLPANGAESANGGDIITNNQYSNFILSVDFKITEGANSGIKYFVADQQPAPASPRSAFGLEFQILDDQKHPDALLGKNGNRTIASLYDLIPAINSKPAVVIGQWNNATIISNNRYVQHWLNGIMVVAYDRQSNLFKQLIANSKYKNIDGFGLNDKGHILLQDHGNRVSFKNIKINTNEVLYNKNASSFFKEIPGVVSFTYRNSFQKNMPATLDSIKALGITNIEFSNLFGKSATEIKKLLDDRGMRCTSFGVSYADLVNKTIEVATNAKALGATYVRVAWIKPDKAPVTFEVIKKAVEDFNIAGKILKDKFNLTFCYHNHGYEMQPYQNGNYFDYMMANTNPTYVSFELDIFWAFHAGTNPVEILKKYPGRFKLMHIKDLRKGVLGNYSGATAIENDVAVGSGQINIAEVLKAAKKSGIQYYYIEDESKDVAQQVPVSLAYIMSL